MYLFHHLSPIVSVLVAIKAQSRLLRIKLKYPLKVTTNIPIEYTICSNEITKKIYERVSFAFVFYLEYVDDEMKQKLINKSQPRKN